MKKLFIFLVVVVALIFGAKFGLEKYYESKLDDVISQARIFADIDYSSVKIGTDGSISINDLFVRPHAVDTSVSTDSITLFSSDILLPINLASFIKRKEMPDELGIRIDNAEYDPSIYTSKDSSQAACRTIETTIDYGNMGISRLNSDVEISIAKNGNDSVFNFSSVDQTAVMNFEMIIDGDLAQAASRMSSPQLNQFTLDYKLDEQIASKLIDTCAEKLGISSEDFIESIVAGPQYLSATGFDFGPAARQALAQTMQGGKWLSISTKPSSSMRSLESLRLYKAKDVVRLLGLKVSLDQEEIELAPSDLVKASASEPETSETPDNLETRGLLANSYLETADESELTEEQLRIKRKLQDDESAKANNFSFKPTAVGDLRKYVNHVVIVDRVGNKKQMTGELITVASGELIIETAEYGGKANFSIAMQDIVEVRVYR